MIKNINWHSVRTTAMTAILFTVGLLQAIHGTTPLDAKIDLVLPLLLAVEHFLAGNSTM